MSEQETTTTPSHVAAAPTADRDEPASLTDAVAALTDEERARIRAAHEDFARSAKHFDQPAEFYLVDLLRWRDYVAEEAREHAKRLRTLPPTADGESPVIAEARAEMEAIVAGAEELAVLTEQLVALFQAAARMRTSAHVAAFIRYSVRTPFFQDTLLRNARYERVRDFARWLLQCVKNAAYRAIEDEQARALPDEPPAELLSAAGDAGEAALAEPHEEEPGKET